MANASHVDRNRLKSVAALEIVQQTAGSCPISSGLVGLWNDAGAIKWRDALGNDSTIPMQSGLPVFAAATTTAAPLAACTYANGTAGVGATLTANANGALGTIGGVNLTSGYLERTVLVDSQVTAAHNGLYSITSVGGGGSTWVLTRVPGMDGSIVDGAMVGVQEGTFAGILYNQTETVTTVGTSDVAFAVSSTGVTWAAIVAAALTANSTLSLKKETNQTINVAASTTAATAGANLSLLSANGNGAVAGDMRIDTGTGTAGGVVKVGDTNAASIVIGKAGVTTTFGPISLAADSNVSCLAGTTAVDLSLGTGVFKTPTGAATLSGSTTIAANKNLDCAAGTTAVDLSLGTGTFKTTTGTFTFQGKQAAAATANVIADPGTGQAIPVTTSGVCMITTAAAETNSLADPTFVGQELSLICDTYAAGDRVVTSASSINQANNTIMTFGAAADMIILRAMKVGGNLRWRVVANDGVVLS